jgi:hypothetical protein
MQMFHNDIPKEDELPPQPMPFGSEPTSYSLPEDLLDIFLETYFEYAHVWCPVLDWATLQSFPQILESPLFLDALALCATRLQPPLIGRTDPEVHYTRAKSLLYGNCERNPMIQVIAIMLFYWWSPGRPNVASLDTGRWWVGTAIRLSEEIGLHHDKGPVETYIGETVGLKRRIWWTLFVSAVDMVELALFVRLNTSLTPPALRLETASLHLLRVDLVSSILNIAMCLW